MCIRDRLEALEATGWAFWIHWLTPLQVELIEKYLEETFDYPINCFVAPSNQILKKAKALATPSSTAKAT